MARGRIATFDPPRDAKGIVLFEVRYDDGVCEGVAGPNYGATGQCSVSAWDKSNVGGCYRRVDDPGSDLIGCGESTTVCGGVIVGCECVIGEGQKITVRGATATR